MRTNHFLSCILLVLCLVQRSWQVPLQEPDDTLRFSDLIFELYLKHCWI